MEVAIVAGAIGLPLSVAIIVLALVVRSQSTREGAANAKALANGEELLRTERVTAEANDRATKFESKLDFQTARADEAEQQLAQTQRLYNAATARLVALKQTQLLGASNEDVWAAVQAELAESLSEKPGTALEKP